MIIKVASFNCQNKKLSKEEFEYKAKFIANHINEKDYDILATQELTGDLISKINKNLKDYKNYGKYRLGNNLLTKYIQVIKNANECNNVITKYKVIYQKTKRLPFIPLKFKELIKTIKTKTLIPRIVTITIIKINNQKICSINTHLGYKSLNVQMRQLKYLLKIIKKYYKKYPIVLTGDFNMDIDSDEFNLFVEKVKIYNLKRVEINEKTNSDKKHKKAIDHIFIPCEWNILEKGINDYKKDNITDHMEIYVIAEFVDEKVKN